jgi:hypothetical protein
MSQIAVPSATEQLDVGVQQMPTRVLNVHHLTMRVDVSATALLLALEQT